MKSYLYTKVREQIRQALVYPDAPGFKANGTSQIAAQAETNRASILRERVLLQLRTSDLTADECAERLGESVLSVRPRLSELIRLGKIEATPLRRKNASGHSAQVWRVARSAPVMAS